MHYKQNNKESRTYVQGLRSFGNTLPRGVKKILKKKKVYLNEILFIKKLYQKFEIFLKLRKKYNKKFIKIFNIFLF